MRLRWQPLFMGERSRNGTIAVRAVKWVVTIYSVYTMLYIRYTEIVWWMLRTTSEKKRNSTAYGGLQMISS